MPNTCATAMRGQQIHHRVRPVSAGFEIHAQRAKARAVGAELDALGAHIGVFAKIRK